MVRKMGIEVNDFFRENDTRESSHILFGQASTTLICLYVSKSTTQVKCSEFTLEAETTFYWIDLWGGSQELAF